MRKLAFFAALLALSAISVFSAEEKTYKNAPVVDANCSERLMSADSDAHTRDCAVKCAGSGYGILTPEKKFLKFDDEGNRKVLAALKASDKKDHLRVDVTGDVQGDTMTVTSIKLL